MEDAGEIFYSVKHNNLVFISENSILIYSFCFILWTLQFLREKKFEQKIPRVIVEDAEKITYEDAKTALRRGLLYFTALQADDGHWPAENAGSIFFNAPFVSYYLLLPNTKILHL